MSTTTKNAERAPQVQSAYALKLEAMAHIEKAVGALIEAGEDRLGGEGNGAKLLDALAIKLSNIHNELRATCTQCGARPHESGCRCSLD